MGVRGAVVPQTPSPGFATLSRKGRGLTLNTYRPRGPGPDPASRGKGPWNAPQTCGLRVRTNVGKDKA